MISRRDVQGVGRLLALGLALAGVAGCTTLAPAHERPAVTLPPAWPAAADPGPAGSGQPLPGWQAYFSDPGLQALIARALAHNHDLRLAALNVERLQATYRIERAGLLPGIAATGSGTHQRLPADLSPTGEAGITRQYGATVGITTFELDFFGRVRSLRDAALETYLASEEAARSARIAVIAEVGRAWLNHAAYRERLTLAEETAASEEKSYALTRRSQEAGVASALDVMRAQTALQRARADAARYAALLAQAGHALSLIVGAPLDVGELPGQLGQAADALAELPAGLPAEVLAERPDVLAAERRLRAADAHIGAARAAFFPRITLTGAAGSASRGLEDLFGGGSETWSFVPQISLPIFQGGRLLAGLDVAETDRKLRVVDYEKTVQSAFRDVADALAERATLAQRLTATRLLVEASAQAHTLSEARYRQGLDSYLSLLDAQRTLYAARQALIDIRLAEALNRIDVYKALGGGA